MTEWGPVHLRRDDFGRLFEALQGRGYTISGPTVRDGAIVYEEIERVEQLPIGWEEEQGPGHYRLRQTGGPACFRFTVGPQSWKRLLHPPRVRLWSARQTEEGIAIEPEARPAVRQAFLGVRSCELAAIARQDRVFLEGAHVDPIYQSNREGTFLVAVNCGQAGGTCFCDSMGTGPRARTGFDLALTEVLEGESHYFVVEAGTEAGAGVLADLPVRGALTEEIASAEACTARAIAGMGRRMETEGLRELLIDQFESPHWDDVASRCLTCANCTMVCPTCFCTTVEDVTDLTGEHAERWRNWDSCFTLDFSYLHGGSVRTSARSRYRQWMTHKLSSWFDQYGSSGCVGCGRCITWCPVGIDLTAEVRAIRAAEGARRGEPDLPAVLPETSGGENQA